jgi:hypothetical protein
MPLIAFQQAALNSGGMIQSFLAQKQIHWEKD